MRENLEEQPPPCAFGSNVQSGVSSWVLALLFSDDCLNSIFRSKVYLLPSLEDIDLRENLAQKD